MMHMWFIAILLYKTTSFSETFVAAVFWYIFVTAVAVVTYTVATVNDIHYSLFVALAAATTAFIN